MPTGGVPGPRGPHAADLDGDGDPDVLAASADEDRVIWFENTGGDFGPQRLITSEPSTPSNLGAADLDQDGDQDVVVGAHGDSMIRWYPNTSEGFGAGRRLAAEGESRAGFAVGDLSPYGSAENEDPEVVVPIKQNQTGTRLVYVDFEGTDPGPPVPISDSDTRVAPKQVVDLSGDGERDLLAATAQDWVIWYPNQPDGFGTARRIDNDEIADLGSVAAADVDGDGDQDILVASDAGKHVDWFENTIAGSGNIDADFGPRHEIPYPGTSFSGILGADLSGDGQTDAVYSGDKGLFWNRRTAEGFDSWQTIADGIGRVLGLDTADVDGDGDLDVLSGSTETAMVAWHENVDDGFSEPQPIARNLLRNPTNVHAGDIDGNGHRDLVVAAHGSNRVLWYPNRDGSFGPPRVVDNGEDGPEHVRLTDVDQDGDLDLVTGASYTRWDDRSSEEIDKITWNANEGGTFGPPQTITTEPFGLSAMVLEDVNGNGYPDLLHASWLNGVVAWHENTGGGFSAQQVIATEPSRPQDLHPADLDGDGDKDLLAVTQRQHMLAWYENTGDGFGARTVISTEGQNPTAVVAADVDGDGDPDVASGSEGPGPVAWHENTGGSFGERQIISTDTAASSSLYAADLDKDGDPDLVSGSFEAGRVTWYQNTGGSFSPPEIVSTETPSLRAVYAADLTGDGYPELLSASRKDHKVAWYRNAATAVASPPDVSVPSQIRLAPNYPNPFNPSTRIAYELPRTMDVRLTVFDLLGREVRTLVNDRQPAGRHEVTFRAADLSGGVYFYRLRTSTAIYTQSMTLVK